MGIQSIYSTIRDAKRILSNTSDPSLPWQSVSRTYIRLGWLSSRNGIDLKQTRILGFDFYYYDTQTLNRLFRDIFVSRIYDAGLDNAAPLILDCGSNIGMSLLFFKARYPDATIIGFEPNPDQFRVLQKNIDANNLDRITIHKKAVSDKTGMIEFFANEDNPGSLNMGLVRRSAKAQVTEVEVDLLSNYITDSVDLLKLDIEGAEESVLRDLYENGELQNIKNIICEYHHHIENGVDRLSESLRMLERAGFGYQLLAASDYPARVDHYQDVFIFAFNRKFKRTTRPYLHQSSE